MTIDASVPDGTPEKTKTCSPPSFERNNLRINRILKAILAINCFALFLYVCLSYKFGFHSDSAAANLLAQEIYETRSYFPKDWNYVNGDLWVLFVHTWLIPFLPFVPNGYALHALGGLIGAGLVLNGTWCVCRTLGMSSRACLVALALVASGFSANMSENLFGQGAYGTIYFLGCYAICSSFNFLYTQGRYTAVWAAISFALFVLVAWSNPHRAAIYNVLPVIVAAVWTYLVLRSQQAQPFRTSYSRLVGLLLIIVSACLIGASLHAYYLARGHSNLAGVSINWLSFSEMGRNASAVLQGLLSLLSGLPSPGQPVANLRGIFDAIRLTSGVALLVLAVWALFRILGTAHPGRLFVGVACLASVGSNLFIFLTTSLPLSSTPESSIRYLVPSLLAMLVILVAVVVDDRRAHRAKRYLGAAAIAIVTATAPIAYELLPLTNHASLKEIDNANQNVRLANFLLKNKLEYGYATFWNAARTTVLSKHIVKVRHIELNNGLPRPMRHLSSDRWYQPSSWEGQSFLLLTEEEMNFLRWPEFTQLVGEPVRKLDFEGFRIFVFDHNIARDFANWSVRVEQSMTYPALESSQHEVGIYDHAAGALVAAPGTAGTLHFGPYQRLEGGRYLVSFDIETEGKGVTDFGRIDVVVNSGNRILGVKTISAEGAQRIDLPIAFEALVRDLEFRVFTSGSGKFMLRNITLTKQAHKNLTSKAKQHAG